jgi:hypothetical protein
LVGRRSTAQSSPMPRITWLARADEMFLRMRSISAFSGRGTEFNIQNLGMLVFAGWLSTETF